MPRSKTAAAVGAGAAALALLALAGLGARADGGPKVAPPGDYATTSLNYYSNDRQSVEGQAIRSFANRIAVESAASGELAPGSRIVGELWTVVTDGEGPVVSALGRKIRDAHAATLVMERIEGADAMYGDGLDIGDWAFAVFNPDGTVKGDGDVSACRACHAPMGDTAFMFTWEHLAKIKAE